MATRGRPRTFDRDTALRRAMEVFWVRGYEGASMDDLTTAMGISKPSLYAAFSCKEALFREALDLYESGAGAAPMTALTTEPTARAAIEAMLRTNADNFADPETPPGCMITLSGILGAPANGTVHDLVAGKRRTAESWVRRRLDRGVADGDLDPSVDTAGVAAFYATVLNGLSIQSRDGATTAAMHAIADRAMAAWDALTAASRS